MKLIAQGICAGVLEATDVEAESGEVTLVAVEGGQRADFLALMLAGRMKPNSGTVSLVDDAGIQGAARHAGDADGRGAKGGARTLRDRAAIIDAPDSSAPAKEMALADVIYEELVFAGVRRTRKVVRELLEEERAEHLTKTPMERVPAETRVRLLARTAAMRDGVDTLIIVTPDRHGGDTDSWLTTATSWAERDYTVIVLVSAATFDTASERLS